MPTSTQNAEIFWLVHDPVGKEHRVLFDGNLFWGHENVTHCIDDLAERPYISGKLLVSMSQTPEMGEWAGYTWVQE